MEISREKQLEREVAQLKSKIRMLEWGAEQYKKSFSDLGSPHMYKVTGKVDRQSSALDILNRKVLSQRFYFNCLRKMGRDLTKDEYLAAKAEWAANKADHEKDRLLSYEDLMADPVSVS